MANLLKSRKAVPIILLLTTLLGALTVGILHESASTRISSSASGRRMPLASVPQYLPYDEQVGATFGQNFTSVAFNVTAVAQEDSTTGIGPAYLLNGLTDSGYWYQVGLSYRWPQANGAPFPGFNMSYEVFMPSSFCGPFGCSCQGSIFPANCQIGTDNLRVNARDIVQLSLTFSGGSVTMQAHDWNTTSKVSVEFSAEGGTQFLGLPDTIANPDGFFTGVMTEQYFATPYNGTGSPVVYRQMGYNISSAMMWMDEFDVNNFQPVFSDQTPSSIVFNGTSLLQYFASHGTAEAASGNEIVTGLTPVTFATLTSSISSVYRPGQRADVAIGVDDPSNLTIRVTSLRITSEFGTFDVTSSAPLNISRNSTLTASIPLPTTLPNGTYIMTISAQIQFRDLQISDWFTAQPISTTSLLTVSGHPVTPSTPSTVPLTLLSIMFTLGEILLPTILAMIAAGTTAAATVLTVTRKSGTNVLVTLGSQGCDACGGVVAPDMLFCPNCGISLRASSGPQTPEL